MTPRLVPALLVVVGAGCALAALTVLCGWAWALLAAGVGLLAAGVFGDFG